MDRYSRQMLFQPIGETGQKKISNKHVLILGCGALGTSNAENLARAGIGKLTLIDRDYVNGATCSASTFLQSGMLRNKFQK